MLAALQRLIKGAFISTMPCFAFQALFLHNFPFSGKEIILRRYLSDQAQEPTPRIGFINQVCLKPILHRILLTSPQALGHLTQEHGPASLQFPLSGQDSSSGQAEHPGSQNGQFTSLPGQYTSLPGQYGVEGGSYHQQPIDPIQVMMLNLSVMF